MIRPGIPELFRLAIRRWRRIPLNARNDVDIELDTHIELRTESLVRAGWSYAAARREATQRFGSLDQTRRTLRRRAATRERGMHVRERIADLVSDVRYATRALVREPGSSVFTIVALALGIGVNVAMFGVVDRLLIRGPEHVRDVDRVRRLQVTTQPAGRPVRHSGRLGYAAYDALRKNTTSFDGVAAYSVTPDGAFLGRGAEARRINRGEATAGFFELLGVRPAAGRFFDEREDDVVSPVRVAVLGYGVWQRDFGGHVGAIGQTIVLNNNDYTIVGVAPKGFTGPDLARVDVWVPESLLGRSVTSNWTSNWNAAWLYAVVRLNPGVTPEQADADATRAFRTAYAGVDLAQREANLSVQPLLHTVDGIEPVETRVSKWLLAVAGCVLLIACANVINLQLARAIRRQRELAVRLTLGAGRTRLIRLLVTEALVLAGAGGIASIAAAAGFGAVLRSRLFPQVEWSATLVDARVLGLSAIVALLVGAVVGVIPAYRASATDLALAMKAGVREGGGRTGRTRAALTMVQVGLSVLLLVGAGLFVQSLRRVRSLDLGIEPDRVVVFSVSRAAVAMITDTAERVREAERRAGYYEAVLAEVRRRPDVERASVAIGLAFTAGFGEDIRVPGRDSIPQLPGGGPYVAVVAPDYFETVGTRIVHGRAFAAGDRRGSAPVAIVNETMAATLWPGENPLGKCFFVGRSPACADVVGVAANSRQFRLRESAAMAYYLPYGQEQGLSGARLVVRPRGNARAVIADVRRQLIADDPSIVFVRADLLQDFVDPQIRPWRLGATMFSLMGVLALVVALVGIYSTMSYLVANRRHELGVRVALGARASDVVALIVRGALRFTVAGAAIGVASALLLAGTFESLLFETSPRDPAVIAAVVGALIATAAFASVVPALRASRVSPMEAMRAE